MAGNNGRVSNIRVGEARIEVHGGGSGARMLVLHGAKDFHPWHA